MKTFRYVEGIPPLTPLLTESVNGKRHYVTPSGARLPSVTTVLSKDSEKGIQEWRAKVGHAEADKIRNRAATRGTKFHTLMERYLRNEDDIFRGVMPDMLEHFRNALKTLDRIDNIHYIECQLYSERLGVAGRTDVIAEFDNVCSVIDFKTSTKDKKESYITNYFEQETAYSVMLEEMTGIKASQIVTIISSDTSSVPQVFVKHRRDYIDGLLTKIKAYKTSHIA